MHGLEGFGVTAAGLIASIPHCTLGVPHSLHKFAFKAARTFISTACKPSNVILFLSPLHLNHHTRARVRFVCLSSFIYLLSKPHVPASLSFTPCNIK